MLPGGEAAKTLAVVEAAARDLARLRVERREPLVAVGGGALGDPAGFLAATYLRGVPWIGVPTTLVAQVDSSIGGKTGVDLPEGKNLVGAFHHPSTIVLDVAMLRSLPERQLRAALGEIVKMAALGDEALFETLEAEGRPSRRRRGGVRHGVVARSWNAPRGRRWRWSPPTSASKAVPGGSAQPGPHRRARAGGGRRVWDAAPRRGGGVRAARRGQDRGGDRRDAGRARRRGSRAC